MSALLSGRWRQQLRRLIETHQLDPAAVLQSDIHPLLAGEEHSSAIYAVPLLAHLQPGGAASDAVGVAPTTTVVVVEKQWWQWDEQP